MIAPTDITGDESMARRVLALARSIAPCLDTLEDEPRLDAIAILNGIAREGMARGSRLVKSQRIATAWVDYVVDGSWFSADDRAALRALCTASSPTGFLPVGQFPNASKATSRIFPLETYEE